MRITINTDCNAPCCPCEILSEDGRSILVQTDWDYPDFARSFGWDMRQVQKCPNCGKVQTDVISRGGAECFDCEDCDNAYDGHTDGIETCDHSQTDGTVNCPDCGLTASDFISAAYDFLRDNDGLSAEDPGYFD